jgi:large subunit ribosomal protein L15
MKIPQRGFSNARFRRELHAVNLGQLEAMFADGEVVDLEALRDKGFINGNSYGFKVLGDGELTKKVEIHATAFSDSAKRKLAVQKIACKVTAIDGSLIDVTAAE